MAEGGLARLDVEGLNKLTRALKKAGVEIQDMKDANARVGTVVVHQAEPITPRATGALAGSIRPAQRRSGVIVRAGGVRGIRYAKFVEFGTSKMAGRSYLIKGARDSQPRWIEVYLRELKQLLGDAASSADGTGD
jgi:HK97 gp10 family phage protein